MWVFERDWQVFQQPTQDSYCAGAPRGTETDKPTVLRFYMQLSNKHKQNCINWSFLLQPTDHYRQIYDEEVLTCSRVLLLTHCSSRQPSRWSGRAAHPWHNTYLPVTRCQLVKQQDKREDRQREQCTHLPSLQWVESMPPAFCLWK